MRGAVAGGSPYTVEAGLFALRSGGNAVDAIVAASLMATVAEPILTGLGGGGLAMVRMGGTVEVVDLFSDMPGLGRSEPNPPVDPIVIDFGPTSQVFHVGPGAVAVPGLAPGLAALHLRHGRLPLAQLVEPAAKAAHQGVEVSTAMERVLHLLGPIQARDPWTAKVFFRDGRPLITGERFRMPELGETLRRFGQEGARLFTEGAVAQAMAAHLQGRGRLTRADLAAYQPKLMAPLRYQYRDATIWVPPPPSVAGLLTLQALRALEDHGPMPAPLSAAQVHFLAHALGRADSARRGSLVPNLFNSSYLEGFLAAIAPEERGEDEVLTGKRRPGHTTHISVVDGEGNAVGLTSSLGETAGSVVPGTGLLLNNFLGEDDVNPAAARIQPGHRLMTMCCPTLVEIGDRIFMLGSSGSSRIRSAILHGIVYLTDHGMEPEEVVRAPRAHVEGGLLHIEADGRPSSSLSALKLAYPGMRRFDGLNMFFGGLHIAGLDDGQMVGAGDPRRSGFFGATHT